MRHCSIDDDDDDGVLSFLSETCEHDILKTNEPILTPIGKSGLRENGMKRSTLWVRRSKIKTTQGRRQIWRTEEVLFSTPLGRVDFLVSFAGAGLSTYHVCGLEITNVNKRSK